mmetsp:Transcript_3853/g.7923  ORF Transcript_3853/g.7923 Transcript_3853/m.7923 type:complete len:95 (-) Transcript_3853:641-925(-)
MSHGFFWEVEEEEEGRCDEEAEAEEPEFVEWTKVGSATPTCTLGKSFKEANNGGGPAPGLLPALINGVIIRPQVVLAMYAGDGWGGVETARSTR